MYDRRRTHLAACIHERRHMVSRKISEAERQRRALQRAMSIEQFCERYEIGRTTAYAEIKEGRFVLENAANVQSSPMMTPKIGCSTCQ